VHRVRAVMAEVFGEENYIDQIVFQTSSGRVSTGLDGVYDVILWFSRNRENVKIRKPRKPRTEKQLDTAYNYLQLEDGSSLLPPR
jgi:adenine-specific DNA-methyltransferase